MHGPQGVIFVKAYIDRMKEGHFDMFNVIERYVDRMKERQNDVLYFREQSIAVVSSSPFVEEYVDRRKEGRNDVPLHHGRVPCRHAATQPPKFGDELNSLGGTMIV